MTTADTNSSVALCNTRNPLPSVGDMDAQDCEEARGLLDQDEKHVSRPSSPPKPQYLVVYVILLLITNLSTFLITANYAGATVARHDEKLHCDRLQPHRSLYTDIDRDSVHSVNFSAFSLQPSRWTAEASNEVDDAWSSLGVEYHTFLVPVSEGPAFGISDDHAIVPPNTPGNADRSGYPVDMEALHQLHCLNLLRKGQFFNHAYYTAPERIHRRPSWAFMDPPANVQAHINHCIDALRERIMCAADTDVVPYYWRTATGLTISDFAVSRQCRNFESVRRFAEEQQLVDWGSSYRLKTPEGAYIASDILP